jgi:hypothetical protein
MRLKDLETTVTSRNDICNEIKRKVNLEKANNSSLQNIIFFRVISKILNIELYNPTNLGKPVTVAARSKA